MVARLHGVETIREFLSGAAVSLILDLPFLLIFLAVMFWYSWQLTLIALGRAAADHRCSSLAVTPLFRERLNQQFLLGARNQAFVTEYVAGMETVKIAADGAAAGAALRRLPGELPRGRLRHAPARPTPTTSSPTRSSRRMTLAILCVGALLVMSNDGFTIGMLVAFQMFAEPHVAADAAPGRAVAGVPAGRDRGQAPGRHDGRARRALRR